MNLSAHNQYWVCPTLAVFLHKSHTSTPSSQEDNKKSISGDTDNHSDYSNIDITQALKGKDNLNHYSSNLIPSKATGSTVRLPWCRTESVKYPCNKMKLIQASPSTLNILCVNCSSLKHPLPQRFMLTGHCSRGKIKTELCFFMQNPAFKWKTKSFGCCWGNQATKVMSSELLMIKCCSKA